MNKNNFLSFEKGIDFIENVLGIKLLEYQKIHLRNIWNNNATNNVCSLDTSNKIETNHMDTLMKIFVNTFLEKED